MTNDICQKCSKKIPPGHRFCGFCGHVVEQPEVDENVAQAETLFFEGAEITGGARLVLLRGDGGDSATYRLNADEHICGRKHGTILFPDDATVSPEHANFYYKNNVLYCRDLDSSNGVYIRLKKRIPLTHKDRFICGQQLFEFHYFPTVLKEQWIDGTCFSGTPRLWDWRFQLWQLHDNGRVGAIHSVGNESLTLGRDNCDLSFPADTFISHYHARILQTRESCMLEDLDSRNGTYYKIRHDVGLQDGDQLFIGRQLIQVEFE